MNTCGDCQYYGNGPVTGPICTKTKKPVSMLMVKDCFEARTTGPVTAMKVCNRCHRELPVTEFHRNHTRKDGYQCECKDCHREMSRAMYVRKKEEQTDAPSAEAPATPVTQVTPATKVCAKCGMELPAEMFGRNVRASTGLKSYCKVCENEQGKKYRAKRYGGKPKRERKPKPVDVPVISTFPDEVLVAELRLRGWRGTIYKDSVTI